MTKRELHEISMEVEQINSEIDWRDPNIESTWFDWADSRIHALLGILEKSLKKTLIRESGLRLVQGGKL